VATRALFGVAIALGAAAAAVSFPAAAPATTGAELIIPLRATLTDRGVVFSAPPRVDLDTTVLFLVTNKGTQARWFQVGTRSTTLRRTRLLRRGQSTRFYYVFRIRGTVPYRSDGPTARLRTGIFRVA
jgi:hypothetical protein